MVSGFKPKYSPSPFTTCFTLTPETKLYFSLKRGKRGALQFGTLLGPYLNGYSQDVYIREVLFLLHIYWLRYINTNKIVFVHLYPNRQCNNT